MTINKTPKTALARYHQLAEQRREIQSLTAEKALERILNAPQPAALVHSFPEQDLHLLINEIGPEDAIPLLYLASNRQWEYLLDAEVWQKDRFSEPEVTRWLNRLLEASPARFVQWFLNEKKAFVEHYLFQNLDIRYREHDQDPAELGEGFISLDGVFYFRLKMASTSPPKTSEDASIAETDWDEEDTEDPRGEFLEHFLKRLATMDHVIFQKVLMETLSVIPTETEDSEYRWRNIRLAEKGFLPFEEAIGLYQAITPDRLQTRWQHKAERAISWNTITAVPMAPIGLMESDDPVARALMQVEVDTVSQEFQMEFATLCNRIIVADGVEIREREVLRKIVQKAVGFLRIGMEGLLSDAARSGEALSGHFADLIRRHYLQDLFKIGWGEVQQLKWKAARWLQKSWFHKVGLPLTFWDEAWTGVLGGLLLTRPLYYDNYRSGTLYREFASDADVRESRETLETVISCDEIFGHLFATVTPPLSRGFLTYKSVLLTMWANYQPHHTDPQSPDPSGVYSLQPMALQTFRDFHRYLFPTAAEGAPQSIPESRKDDFLAWLSLATQIAGEDLADRVGNVLNELFADIETELGSVVVEDLDARFVQLFMIEREPSE